MTIGHYIEMRISITSLNILEIGQLKLETHNRMMTY